MTRLAAEFDNVEIVAGCDIRTHNWFEKQLWAPAAMADLFPNATFYEDYDEMLEKADLDIVLVETGADIHAEFCAKALEKNINVLTDIPVVANLKEAERLWKAAEKSEAIISVGPSRNRKQPQQFVSRMLCEFKAVLNAKKGHLHIGLATGIPYLTNKNIPQHRFLAV